MWFPESKADRPPREKMRHQNWGRTCNADGADYAGDKTRKPPTEDRCKDPDDFDLKQKDIPRIKNKKTQTFPTDGGEEKPHRRSENTISSLSFF